MKATQTLHRADGRTLLDLRPVSIELDATPHAEGSCLIRQGVTRVLIAATVEEKTPPFLRDKGEGWVTAEYGMLPRATHERSPREAVRGRQSGRTLEIQRLIGRALRGVVDRKAFPDLTITLDCDVIAADAGTRCASVTGAFVALTLALARMAKEKRVRFSPIREQVAAISVGLLSRPPSHPGGAIVALDLDYSEDSTAEVDLNLVGTSSGRFVEIQGTAEGKPFDDSDLAAMIGVGRKGLGQLFLLQREVLEGRAPDEWLDRRSVP
jgi:ribonuclease PH